MSSGPIFILVNGLLLIIIARYSFIVQCGQISVTKKLGIEVWKFYRRSLAKNDSYYFQ